MLVHRLANGQQVLIRPIEPGDGWRLQEGLRRLSLETVRRRFLAARPRFTSAELRYLTEVDAINHIALVAFAQGRLVAVARAVRVSADCAEWAIVVGDPLQRLGLGTLLMQALVDAAAAQGIHRFSATIDGENVAVARLLAHARGHFEHDAIHAGVREVTIDLAA
jgi:RimJ/RimL family protein N-acetyltransferase